MAVPPVSRGRPVPAHEEEEEDEGGPTAAADSQLARRSSRGDSPAVSPLASCWTWGGWEDCCE